MDEAAQVGIDSRCVTAVLFCLDSLMGSGPVAPGEAEVVAQCGHWTCNTCTQYGGVLLPSFPQRRSTTSHHSVKHTHHSEAATLRHIIVQEAYLATRHIVDILREMMPPRPKKSSAPGVTVEQLLSVLRPLQPRLYSISSSPLEDSRAVQATIAEVK